MPKLDGIATFVAIAEAGLLSEATRRLRFRTRCTAAWLGMVDALHPLQP